MKSILLWAMLLPLFIINSANAQKNSIVIGQTSAFSGGPMQSVLEITAGAKLVIDEQNARGGIRGKKLELISLDDGYDPAKAIENTKRLVRDHGAIALFLSRGTQTSEAIVPTLNQLGVPLIAPSTGALSLRTPTQKLVFNVRSSHRHEARKLFNQLFSMGYQQIGIVHVDDSFGRDVLAGLREGYLELRVRPSFVEKFSRDEKDYTRIIDSAVASQPRALILVGTTKPVLDLVTGLRKAGLRSFMATLSNNAAGSFAVDARRTGAAVIVSQVFPNENSLHIPLVREAQALAKAAASQAPAVNYAEGSPLYRIQEMLTKGVRVTPAMLEGVAAAKVLIEGLKRTSGDPTSSGLIDALNSGKPIDIGWPGKEIRYSVDNHFGIEHVETSIITENGKYLR